MNFNAVHFKLIPKNPLTIGSLFKIKDRLGALYSSCVVYEYTCPRCKRGKYIGCTQRLLKVRIDSHRGVSHRTGVRLANPEFSSIRDHVNMCKSSIEYKDFKVIEKVTACHSLNVLESLTIKKAVPLLNT